MTAGARVFDLAAYLQREGERAEVALGKAAERLDVRLPAELGAAARHGVLSGGKRLRPVLCVTAYRAVAGAPPATVYDLAASMELIHAYSLMHDDLPCMDDAELRRGRPTTHRVHGEAATARAGAALIPAAALQAWEAASALGLGAPAARAIVRELCRAAGAGGMVGGQALDLLAEGRALDAGALDALHRRKTGALLRSALVLGGRAGGASRASLEALGRYGDAVGLAFQITDDVLDATASAEELGKEPSDAHLGKSTYVALHGVGEARRRARLRADEAVRALAEAGLDAPALEALATYVVERRR